jgi:hypothetical protein
MKKPESKAHRKNQQKITIKNKKMPINAESMPKQIPLKALKVLMVTIVTMKTYFAKKLTKALAFTNE